MERPPFSVTWMNTTPSLFVAEIGLCKIQVVAIVLGDNLEFVVVRYVDEIDHRLVDDLTQCLHLPRFRSMRTKGMTIVLSGLLNSCSFTTSLIGLP
jgi:hypothetical protein